MSAVAELDRPNIDPRSHTAGSAGTHEASSSGPPLAEPSEEQLLDVLYEVLATGPAPKSRLTREQVERFLHEHARSAKPIREMIAFFQQHDLPLVRPDEYGSDAGLRELASGLQRERSSLVPGLIMAEPDPAPVLPPATVEAIRREAQPADDAVSTGRHAAVVVAAPVKSGPHWSAWFAAAATLLALGAGLAFSYLHANTLEDRLEQARLQQKSTDVALSKLEQRAETLQGELKQSETDRRAQQARFEDALEAQAKRRATEELAVEKMLGARYTKLRQKLANDAANLPANAK